MRFSFHDDRLAELERELRPAGGQCPFIVLDPSSASIRLTHLSGGRDAMYVAIDDPASKAAREKQAEFTIGYAPYVEGTTLIYDLTDETLQGKARPFNCVLGPRGRRAYAVLPVQIESIQIRLISRQIDVEFQDALGERIEAALPFHLTVSGAGHPLFKTFACTARGGRFARGIPASLGAAPPTVAVRSLLTGREERLALQR